MKSKIFFTKLTKWEHWPTYMFYVPVLPYAFYQAFKHKSTTFFLNANPGIKNSGDGTDSKHKTLQLVPKKHLPKSVLIDVREDFALVLDKIANSKIEFPLIAKPDMGFRGLLVKKINSKEELESYLIKNNSILIILQEFISYKNECGILYYRLPNNNKGKITSITLKKFLKVVGNGKSTLSELIISDERAFLYYDLLQNIHKKNMQSIPNKNKEIILTVIGNHSKGTEFLNGNHLISEKLEKSLDTLNKQMDGWFFGRLDIKYESFEQLINGKNFKILEINGILAEPTHIYDTSFPNSSYFNALKAIKNNWKVISIIASQNRKNLGIKAPNPLEYIKQMFTLRRYAKKLIALNENS